MFAQIIRGKTSDPKGVRALMDRWLEELGSTAEGWLGETSGVTDDGQLFALVRFESAEAAKANSDKPEQGQWWSEMEKLLEGEVSFQDSSNVIVQSVGDPNTAGFVQVMDGRSSDPDRSVQLMNSSREARVANRPDILGSVVVGHGDGKFTMVVYFVSEEEARNGESKAIPEDLKATMQEIMSLSVGTPEFLDLKEPWLDSPK